MLYIKIFIKTKQRGLINTDLNEHYYTAELPLSPCWLSGSHPESHLAKALQMDLQIPGKKEEKKTFQRIMLLITLVKPNSHKTFPIPCGLFV